MVESEVSLRLRLEVVTKKDGDTWVAWCLPIDVLSQGKTKVRSIDSLKHAVELWFESCIERGVLEKALLESGFQPIKDGEVVPSDASSVHVHEKKRRRPAKPSRASYITVSVPAYSAALHSHAGATR